MCETKNKTGSNVNPRGRGRQSDQIRNYVQLHFILLRSPRPGKPLVQKCQSLYEEVILALPKNTDRGRDIL